MSSNLHKVPLRVESAFLKNDESGISDPPNQPKKFSHSISMEMEEGRRNLIPQQKPIPHADSPIENVDIFDFASPRPELNTPHETDAPKHGFNFESYKIESNSAIVLNTISPYPNPDTSIKFSINPTLERPDSKPTDLPSLFKPQSTFHRDNSIDRVLIQKSSDPRASVPSIQNPQLSGSNVMDVEETKKRLENFKKEMASNEHKLKNLQEEKVKKAWLVDLVQDDDRRTLSDICGLFLADYGELSPEIGWLVMEVSENSGGPAGGVAGRDFKCCMARDDPCNFKPRYQIESLDYKECKNLFADLFDLFGAWDTTPSQNFESVDRSKLDRLAYNCFMRSFYWSSGHNLGIASFSDLQVIQKKVCIEILGIKKFNSTNGSGSNGSH